MKMLITNNQSSLSKLSLLSLFSSPLSCRQQRRLMHSWLGSLVLVPPSSLGVCHSTAALARFCCTSHLGSVAILSPGGAASQTASRCTSVFASL